VVSQAAIPLLSPFAATIAAHIGAIGGGGGAIPTLISVLVATSGHGELYVQLAERFGLILCLGMLLFLMSLEILQTFRDV
jgi:hypothetical protein